MGSRWVNHGRILSWMETKNRRDDAADGVRVDGGMDEKHDGSGCRIYSSQTKRFRGQSRLDLNAWSVELEPMVAD